MIRSILFLIICNIQFCQSLAIVNPKTYFKPDLRRKESRLTGCQILVLKESKSSRSLNNPFLRRSLGFSKTTKLVKNVRVSLNGKSPKGSIKGLINLKRLRPGNHTLIIETDDFKLPLNFALRWEEEILVLVLLPRDKKTPVGALIRPKRVLAGVEFRQMLADLKSWQTKVLQVAQLKINPIELVSDNYVDEIGKKEDFVDYLTVWKKRLHKIEIKSYTMRSINHKSRLNIQFTGYEEESDWTKCLDLLINDKNQVMAYEVKDCSQNFFALWKP